MTLFILTIIGAGVGLLSSFLGLGGGIITIPILYALFPNYPPTIIMATSLGTVFFNSSWNIYIYTRKKSNYMKSQLILISVFAIMSFLITSNITLGLSARTLKFIFGYTLLFAMLKVIYVSYIKKIKTEQFVELYRIPSWKFPIVGIVGGTVAGLTGLGGGIIMIPLLMTWIKLPSRLIPLYSNVGIVASAITGIIRYATVSSPISLPYNEFVIGKLNLFFIFFILLGSVPFSLLGRRFNNKIKQETKIKIYLVVLCLAAIKIFIKA